MRLCCKVVDQSPATSRPANGAHTPARLRLRASTRATVRVPRAFCEWMIAQGLGEEWKPERAKFALFVRNNGTRMTAHVDPGAPNAWKREPYYTNFKRWAAEGGSRTPIHLVDVMIGERLIVVLPDREIEFGVLRPDQSVQMERRADARSMRGSFRRRRSSSLPSACSQPPIRSTASRISAAEPA